MDVFESLRVLLPMLGVAKPSEVCRSPFLMRWEDQSVVLAEVVPSTKRGRDGYVWAECGLAAQREMSELCGVLAGVAECFLSPGVDVPLPSSGGAIPVELRGTARLLRIMFPDLEKPDVVDGLLCWPRFEVSVGVTPPAATACLFEFFKAWRAAESRESAGATVSSHEQRLIAALSLIGMPEPKRDWRVKREDGSLLTVPDMVWPDHRLVVEVDGFFWHRGRDAAEVWDRSTVLELDRLGAVKDAKKRRVLAAMGFRVAVVFDFELESEEQALAVAKEIRAMI